MLTTKDVNKLIEVMKTTFATKDEMNAGFNEMNKKFTQLQTSVDGILKIAKDHPQEIASVGSRVDNLERWVKKASPKVGVEYNT